MSFGRNGEQRVGPFALKTKLNQICFMCHQLKTFMASAHAPGVILKIVLNFNQEFKVTKKGWEF